MRYACMATSEIELGHVQLYAIQLMKISMQFSPWHFRMHVFVYYIRARRII